MSDDIEIGQSTYWPCTGVTITPLAAGGLPDYDHTGVHVFDPPITLAYAHRTHTPKLDQPLTTGYRPEPALLGFTAARDYRDTQALDRLAAELAQPRIVAVQIRTPQPDGPDLFLLIARWLSVPNEEWPQTAPDAPSTLVAIGKALPATTPHPWPGLDSGVQLGNAAVLFRFVHTPDARGAA